MKTPATILFALLLTACAFESDFDQMIKQLPNPEDLP